MKRVLFFECSEIDPSGGDIQSESLFSGFQITVDRDSGSVEFVIGTPEGGEAVELNASDMFALRAFLELAK